MKPTSLAEPTAPRFDMYLAIHKALRACMSDTLVRLGRVDAHDAAELAVELQRVHELLTLCASHLRHEDQFLHPVMEKHRPGSQQRAADEHLAHERTIASLADGVDTIAGADADQRARMVTDLYRQLALFCAESCEHMHLEETEHNAVLWATHTDAELVSIHDALVASIAPQEMAQVMRWIIPHVSHAERVGILADMQGKAPAPAFQGALALAQSHLDARDWAKLADALGFSALKQAA